MAAATVARWKGMITACAFGAVTFVGTIYGAGLKTQQEYKAEKQRVVEASVEEKVAMLEERRKTLVTQRTYLEGKLARLHARMAEKEDRGSSGSGR